MTDGGVRTLRNLVKSIEFKYVGPLGCGSKMLPLWVVIRVDPPTQKHFPLYYTSPQPLIYNININKELIYTKEFL